MKTAKQPTEFNTLLTSPEKAFCITPPHLFLWRQPLLHLRNIIEVYIGIGLTEIQLSAGVEELGGGEKAEQEHQQQKDQDVDSVPGGWIPKRNGTGPQQLPGIGVPQAGAAIIGTRENALAIRGESDAVYIGWMLEVADRLAGIGIPQPGGVIPPIASRARENALAIRGEGHATYRI